MFAVFTSASVICYVGCDCVEVDGKVCVYDVIFGLMLSICTRGGVLPREWMRKSDHAAMPRSYKVATTPSSIKAMILLPWNHSYSSLSALLSFLMELCYLIYFCYFLHCYYYYYYLTLLTVKFVVILYIACTLISWLTLSLVLLPFSLLTRTIRIT